MKGVLMGDLLPMEGIPPKRGLRTQSRLAEASFLLFGRPANKAEWGRWGKAMSLLEEAEVGDAELALLTLAYRAKFPNVPLTLMAIATRPGELRRWIENPPPLGETLARELEWRRQIAEQEKK
jgi:hypothetical protein